MSNSVPVSCSPDKGQGGVTRGCGEADVGRPDGPVYMCPASRFVIMQFLTYFEYLKGEIRIILNFA